MTSTTFFIIFIPILAILLLAINLLLAPHNPYQEKDSVFECGFHSFLGQNRTQFSISFFIFGLLFLHPTFAVETQLSLIINYTKMSGFYKGKGKGKLIVPDEEESVKQNSSSDIEEDNDSELRKAISLSLQNDKKGESSKNEVDSSEVGDFELILRYNQTWNNLKDRFKTVAIQHNLLREKVNIQAKIDKSDSDNLSKFLGETNELKVKIKEVENKLIQLGVDPSQQSGYKSESESDRYSDYSSYSSDTSEARPTKRVKRLNSDDNTNMTSVFPIFNIMSFTFIIRFLSVMTSGVFL
jgi:NADH:ubiquinone oxidoreductase subunit 3 (subunit A)